MARTKDVLLAGVMYGAAWAGIGGAVGATIDSAEGGNSFRLAEDARSTVAATEQRIVDLEGQVIDFTGDTGELCVAALRPYRVGEQLADVPESDAVTDLVGKPNKACGTDPTTVRAVLRTDRGLNQALSDERASLPGKRDKIEEREKIAEDDKQFSGWLTGMIALGSIGGIWGGARAPGRFKGHNYKEFTSLYNKIRRRSHPDSGYRPR